MNATVTRFLVDQSDLRKGRFVHEALPPLADGQVLLKIDRFAFTANNVTYAETGERLGYWKFFPTGEGGWGTIPVWGFADVVASRVLGIEEGERIYGFLPMATHLVVRPDRIGASGFIDSSPHRQELPAAYNGYVRCRGDALYRKQHEDLQALLRPLFITSFLIDDFLDESEFFGAKQVVCSSASSKTAFGLAHLLHRRDGVDVIGLTSAGNRAFVESLGCYRRTVLYGDLAQLPRERTAYVDFAGSANVRTALHAHFGDALTYSCAVGMSHRELNPPGRELPGPRPTFFFAPDRVRKRAKDWGREGFDQRFGAAWRDFVPQAANWLEVHVRERDALPAIHAATLEGRVAANCGQIVTL